MRRRYPISRGWSVELERLTAHSVSSRVAENGDPAELGSRSETRMFVPLERTAVHNPFVMQHRADRRQRLARSSDIE